MAPEKLTITLQNTSPDEIYAYVSGIDIATGSRVFIQADGHTLYHPVDPDHDQAELKADVAIKLGTNMAKTEVVIPRIAGGRIWFSRGQKLKFLLNRSYNAQAGAALVEPSVLNRSDPNAGIDFTFCEFTFNAEQLYANISYVDYVSRLPIALTLQRSGGNREVQHVSGMRADAFNTVCNELRAQAKRDGRPWDKLIVPHPNKPNEAIRVLNPSHADEREASFAGYYEPYVDKVWQFFSRSGGKKLGINTQNTPGVVHGSIDNEMLIFDADKFPKPTTKDIFGCNTGTFVTGGNALRNAVIPRLAAGFNRTTLLTEAIQPTPDASTFYKADPTNHYCRIVHAANLDGKGYGFAYDDVQADGAPDQSGKTNAGDPHLFLVAVGGYNVYAGDRLP